MDYIEIDWCGKKSGPTLKFYIEKQNKVVMLDCKCVDREAQKQTKAQNIV